MILSGISQNHFLVGIDAGQLFFVSMSCNVDIRAGPPWSIMGPEPLNPIFHRCLFNFHYFFRYLFSENFPGYSNVCFWNVLHFSTSYPYWRLPKPASWGFSWDYYCIMLRNYPKTIAGNMLFFREHLQKVRSKSFCHSEVRLIGTTVCLIGDFMPKKCDSDIYDVSFYSWNIAGFK